MYYGKPPNTEELGGYKAFRGMQRLVCTICKKEKYVPRDEIIEKGVEGEGTGEEPKGEESGASDSNDTNSTLASEESSWEDLNKEKKA
jgi:hypothetical protein